MLHAPTEPLATVEREMATEMATKRPHRHTVVVKHELRQRAGVPYEVEITVCAACDRVLARRPLKRAAA